MPLPPPVCSDSDDGLLPRLIWRCEMLRCRPIAPASAVGDDPRCDELDRDGPCLLRDRDWLQRTPHCDQICSGAAGQCLVIAAGTSYRRPLLFL